MTFNVVPLNSAPNQLFNITIPLANKNLRLSLNVRYNSEAEYWTLTITNSETGIILIDSLPLVTGEYPSADLLQQFGYLNLGSMGVVKTKDILTDRPDDSNLGTDFLLLWGD
jgi:hypothetical protein